jgi:3-deoxy-manno-octulosonate cytidylyltransferase (CMP-KDO synthetase)
MTPERILVCVPARLASTRLPNKLMAQLGNQLVIDHVCERIQGIAGRLRSMPTFAATQVETWVVTDAEVLAERARAKGIEVFLSQQQHQSGSARIGEFVQSYANTSAKRSTKDAAGRELPTPLNNWLDRALVVNVQGDEPFVDEADVCALISGFVTYLRENAKTFGQVPVATLVHKNSSMSDFLDPSAVKVVRRRDGLALYFSRAPIPWPRQVLGTAHLGQRELVAPTELPPDWGFWQHLGIYVYIGSYLSGYHQVSVDSDLLEVTEGLEQLGVLSEGKQIWTTEARVPSLGIDTQADLDRARRLLT